MRNALIGMGTVLLVTSTSLSVANVTAGCPNFAHLQDDNLPVAAKHGSLSKSELLLARIDDAVTVQSLDSTFDCLFSDHTAIAAFFGDEPFVTDEDVFQFAFSEYAYGKILINKSHSAAYLDGRSMPGLKILKITFDYDSDGYPFIDEFVGFRQNSAKEVSFSRYTEGEFLKDNKPCLVCHDKQPKKLFFKSKFQNKITRK